MHDWLADWPALALACGLPLAHEGRPRIPSPSQQCKRGQTAGAPLPEALFILTVLTAIRRRLIGARDLINDSAPILAWRRADPDTAVDHAPAQHARPLLRGYRVHTLLCRGSGLPIFFLLSPVATSALVGVVGHRTAGRLDLHGLHHCGPGCSARLPSRVDPLSQAGPRSLLGGLMS
jgi:hypothetical protein